MDNLKAIFWHTQNIWTSLIPNRDFDNFHIAKILLTWTAWVKFMIKNVAALNFINFVCMYVRYLLFTYYTGLKWGHQLGLYMGSKEVYSSTYVVTTDRYYSYMSPRTTDTQWRHKSNISEKMGRCGRQNMLPPYLKIWEWEWIFGRAVKAISSLGVRSPWFKGFHT